VTNEPDTSVVVIGAGQAGLSVSYYLKRLGLDAGNEFVVLDRGPTTGGAWQHRWDALRIGSAHRINDLPGMDALGVSFETADRHLPAKDVVADYYRQYEEHYDFKIVRPAAVSRVENEGTHLLVRFNDGQGEQTVSTDIVINATGTWGAPFVPYYPGSNTFEGRQLHTTDYTDATEFAGQKVVVVGGGTSAIGFLLELENVADQLTWVSRRPIDFLEDGELNLEARASAVQMQDEAARAGKALPSIVSGTGVPRTRRIQAGIDRGLLQALPMFASIEPTGVRWANGAFMEADVILWSTGFRPELRHLAPLKLREKEGGIVVASGTAWKDPRIFFAGYGPQASTIGANRAGRTIARQVVATMSRMKRLEREEREEAEARERELSEPFYSYVLPAQDDAAPQPGVDLGAAWEPVAEAPVAELPAAEPVEEAEQIVEETASLNPDSETVEPASTAAEIPEVEEPEVPDPVSAAISWLEPTSVPLAAEESVWPGFGTTVPPTEAAASVPPSIVIPDWPVDEPAHENTEPDTSRD